MRPHKKEKQPTLAEIMAPAMRAEEAKEVEKEKKFRGKMTIAVDFDGPIHSYTTPWINEHTIPDPPTDGSARALAALCKIFNVVIHSSRCRTPAGVLAVRDYMSKNGLPFHEVSATKPPAWLTIDDRVVCFDGRWGDTLSGVENFIHFRDEGKPEEGKLSKISRLQHALHQVRKTLHI